MRYAKIGTASLSIGVLRGLGQIFLQENFATGLILLSASFLCGRVDAACALLGTMVATSTAILAGSARRDVEAGLHGFNGALVGFALAGRLDHDAALFIYTTIGAAFAALSTSVLERKLASWERVLTAPFVMATWILLGAMAYLGGPSGTVGGAPSDARPGDAGTGDLSDAVQGVLNGLSQIVLQRSPWLGLAVAAALAVASRSACAAALIGSAVGYASASALGADPAAMRDGLYGYNAALTAIAAIGLASRKALPAVAAALVMPLASTVAYAWLSPVLGRAGIPVLTSPFVVTTWICILAQAGTHRVRCRARGRADRACRRAGSDDAANVLARPAAGGAGLPPSTADRAR